MSGTTIHASAVLVGTRALLIRGPAGAGKSSLVLALIEAARSGQLPFARLVGDDRVLVDPTLGRLVVRPAPALAGLLEVRGFGIRRMEFEPVAAVGWVTDLAAADGGRMPEAESGTTIVEGVILPRLPVVGGVPPLPAVLAFVNQSGLEKGLPSH